MVRQKEILNSSEETKTGSCNSCGQEQRLATSCREDVEGEAERLLDSARANEQDSENSHVSQEQDDDRTVDRDETRRPTLRLFLDEGALTRSLLNGLVKLCTF